MAKKMEMFIAACCEVDMAPKDDSDAEIQKFIDAVTAAKGSEVKYAELQNIVALIDHPSYASKFITVANKIKKFGCTPDKMEVMPMKTWDAIKSKIASALSYENFSIKGDKWNPADLLIMQKGYDYKFLESDMDVAEKILKFESDIADKKIFPFSIKQDSRSMVGSRGITKILNDPKAVENPYEVCNALSEKLGIPVKMTSHGKPLNTIHFRLLNFLQKNGTQGLKELAVNYDLAYNIHGVSSSYYIVKGEEGTEIGFHSQIKDYKPSRIKRIIINTNGNQAWLEIGSSKETGVVRYKGSNTVYISIEGKPIESQTLLESFESGYEMRLDESLFTDFDADITIEDLTKMVNDLLDFDEDNVLYKRLESKYGKAAMEALAKWVQAMEGGVENATKFHYKTKEQMIEMLYNYPSNKALKLLGKTIGGGSSGVVVAAGENVIKKLYERVSTEENAEFYVHCLKTKHPNLLPVVRIGKDYIVSKRVEIGTPKCREYEKEFNKLFKIKSKREWQDLAWSGFFEANRSEFKSDEIADWFIATAKEMEKLGPSFGFGDFRLQNIGEYKGHIVFIDP